MGPFAPEEGGGGLRWEQQMAQVGSTDVANSSGKGGLEVLLRNSLKELGCQGEEKRRGAAG